MRSARASVLDRPKSANVSQRGTLVALLSPRPGNRDAVLQAPQRWSGTTKPIISRYCLIDKPLETMPPTSLPVSMDVAQPLFEPRRPPDETPQTAITESEPTLVLVLPQPSVPSSPTPRRPKAPPASPSTECFHVRQARMQAEENARLLANRVAFLEVGSLFAISNHKAIRLDGARAGRSGRKQTLRGALQRGAGQGRGRAPSTLAPSPAGKGRTRHSRPTRENARASSRAQGATPGTPS